MMDIMGLVGMADMLLLITVDMLVMVVSLEMVDNVNIHAQY